MRRSGLSCNLALQTSLFGFVFVFFVSPPMLSYCIVYYLPLLLTECLEQFNIEGTHKFLT